MTAGQIRDTTNLKHAKADHFVKTRDKNSSKDKGSDRSGWWRSTLKESPIPGTYEIRDFIREAQLNPVKQTYCFKGEGRKKGVGAARKGDLLLPGAYSHTDCIQLLEKQQVTYSFKNSPRKDAFMLCYRDKDMNTSPCQYDMFPKPVARLPCKYANFRSTVLRFPTIYFVPKTPGPGTYEASRQMPTQTKAMATMGHLHGLFFRNAFEF
ncbi:protein STPG4 isoform X2 [Acipenser ruthenus]|uniref:protein STPG4 isoform X2 n=1 Tax=Acipenser ruthenus TaxID=7906 RepID=UPI00145A70BD|nr:protein STPG4 isoform X2 [Acipenser ruthenus]